MSYTIDIEQSCVSRFYYDELEEIKVEVELDKCVNELVLKGRFDKINNILINMSLVDKRYYTLLSDSLVLTNLPWYKKFTVHIISNS